MILNGTPRAGKSSIAAAIQASFEGVWLNLGVDHFKAMIPQKYQPGIGLRPGGERPDLEPLVAKLYYGMYESIAAHSRLGVNAVVDVGHHDCYSTSLGILQNCARKLEGLPVLFVGIRCPLEVNMERRRQTWGMTGSVDDPENEPVRRWHREVHVPGIYDMEIDTDESSPEEGAEAIRRRLQDGPHATAFSQLAML